jgi:hypothetical protein
LTFEYGGCVLNLLDTAGHEDFTNRTLTAVDSAILRRRMGFKQLREPSVHARKK